MSKRKSHLKKVVSGPKTKATPLEQPMTEAEVKDNAQNIAIGKLYEEMKETIDDPVKLAIVVARIWGESLLMTYKQHKGIIDVKLPKTTGESGKA
ncbi:MAG: hypothetical protein KAU20_06870 [Nanoarchaeota archaeon]|nr:hypothetical protein [Nanoarchaeota archaeon]